MDVQIHGYTVRVRRAGPGRVLLVIGKKVRGGRLIRKLAASQTGNRVFDDLVGKGGEMDLVTARAAVLAITGGLGVVTFADQEMRVSGVGDKRVVSLATGGAIELTPDETAAIVAAAEAAITEAGGAE